MVKYLLVGGSLTPLYAESRYTQDIDLVIQIRLDSESFALFVGELEKHAFEPFTTWADALLPGSDFFTCLAPHGLVKIDMNLVSKTPASAYKRLAQLAMPRRVRVKLLDIECWAQSKEDFILAKLVYSGFQDYKDALACWVRNVDELDITYLKTYAKILGVEQYFDALQNEKNSDEIFPED